MNQSNQSLQVSKNDSFSEQIQPNQNRTENHSQIAPLSYNVDAFAVGTKHKILSEHFALKERADQWAKEADPEKRQELFLHSTTYYFGSEFSRYRQNVLTLIIGATRGLYFVIHGGDDSVKRRRYSTRHSSRS
ncbi:hypothetical protein IVG45_18870 [Methylomonas sp. LL1]|uniref:hypothetical protein n=1 Tax=Methylomonas sp. LL1 TaxID=2785785 RepID=UPI0018C35E12|nr:hypothetical protein [Methylomonas sp. LL1]QPK62865.1 hypothetical protein IVG45_18870 [Methylomonas sp. LL1]